MADGGEQKKPMTTRIPFPIYEWVTTKPSRLAERAIDVDARTKHELARDLSVAMIGDEEDGGYGKSTPCSSPS